ncbi:hypothetical protein QA600_09995 [Natronococcus sp. A-GB1]|uniref:DUF7010 family protein n=1 Tax=Natronococcus sp. A-GB1 TaxID=3037648 RepID=UPI00241C3518|nr:hypothetical protein [Natronococcus sp. A-GB1]MDG5759672.1 hypothetical protein [Natronococcus sp. A-GB1]
MEVTHAQREMRTVYANGTIGQAVSGVVWLLSASLGTLLSVQVGIITLVIGGIFIFPLTQLVLRISGRPTTVHSENPLSGLAMQVAFIVPILIPVIGAATIYNVNWFYPAFLLVVGAHYLPFVFYTECGSTLSWPLC